MRQSASVTIGDLRDRPDLRSSVADRVWRAWWEPEGCALGIIESVVQDNLGPAPVPFALVAHDARGFVGTASVIACDLEIRSQYTPWVAAVWLDPGHRRQGVGSRLVQAPAETARGLGFDRVYLCALPANHAFYGNRGWRMIERDVAADGLSVFRSP